MNFFNNHWLYCNVLLASSLPNVPFKIVKEEEEKMLDLVVFLALTSIAIHIDASMDQFPRNHMLASFQSKKIVSTISNYFGKKLLNRIYILTNTSDFAYD